MTNSNEVPAPRITAAAEAELMAAFHAWFALWSAAGQAYGAERNELDAQAAEIFNAQVARGGAYRAAWILIQDTLSNWWELPEQMRGWLRTAPVHEGYADRAVRAEMAALETEEEDDSDD